MLTTKEKMLKQALWSLEDAGDLLDPLAQNILDAVIRGLRTVEPDNESEIQRFVRCLDLLLEFLEGDDEAMQRLNFIRLALEGDAEMIACVASEFDYVVASWGCSENSKVGGSKA